MKNLLLYTVVAVGALLMFGCSAMDNPLAPPSGSGNNDAVRPQTVQWQFPEGESVLPYPAGDVTKGDISGTELVTVERGGKVKAEFELTTPEGKKVQVHAELKVPRNAVTENVLITMTLDTERVAMKFEPEGLLFTTPATLDFHVNHLNSLPEDQSIQPVYLEENGATSPITYEDLDIHRHSDHTDVNLKKGNISHFSIVHFSIYAFGR